MRALHALSLAALLLGAVTAACVIGPKQDDPVGGTTPDDRGTDTGIENETPAADSGGLSTPPDATAGGGDTAPIDAAADAVKPDANDAEASAEAGDASDASSDSPSEGG